MIIMDLKIDNFYAFNNFHINFSYPKKIINSYIENEHLEGLPNFRYKKVNIIMGSNATGKTSLGKMILSIFNLMYKRNLDIVTGQICDTSKDASFTMDFVDRQDNQYFLYRIVSIFKANKDRNYSTDNTKILINSVKIKTRDSYEVCAERLDVLTNKDTNANYITELEKVMNLSWIFTFPFDSYNSLYSIIDNPTYLKILEHTLNVLDPAITSVKKIPDIEGAFTIRMGKNDIILQNGKIVNEEMLSSGTKAGIRIASILASIKLGNCDFYYCDEMFSYIHSDIEKAILSLMISLLKDNTQLIFTSHNLDLLDFPLPKHSFTFLKKEIYEDGQIISAVNAADYLKKNTDSLRNAVDNDLFSSSPSLESLYEIEDL